MITNIIQKIARENLTPEERKFLVLYESNNTKKTCKDNHECIYSPYTKNGSCRFCWGYKKLTDSEICQLVFK